MPNTSNSLDDLHLRRLRRLRGQREPQNFHTPPTPDSSPERENQHLPLASHHPNTRRAPPNPSTLPAPTLTAPVPRNVSGASPIPEEVKENTYYISVSAFHNEHSVYPCILECYSASARLLSPGVVIKHNNRLALLKQWLCHIFDTNPKYPRVLLVDNFLSRLVGDLYNDRRVADVLKSRKLKLVFLNPVLSLNNSLNIPFEVTDKAFKEFVTVHSSHSIHAVDLSAHTECCYKRAASQGFTTFNMQRGWTFTNLEKVWKKAGVAEMDLVSEKMDIEMERIRIKHAWEAIERTHTMIEEHEKEIIAKYHLQKRGKSTL
ncbi:Hypothetical protein conserved in the Yarrowia clade [Yarrowia lipolytica]|nr:Hypothetical protein conserved in the Yarrowia clade [Yarrowia lipolytica]